MPDVRSMCAIGMRGQLGLHGELPWEGDPRPEFRADVERFFDDHPGPRPDRRSEDHRRGSEVGV